MTMSGNGGWARRDNDPEGVQRWHTGQQWTTHIVGGQVHNAIQQMGLLHG